MKTIKLIDYGSNIIQDDKLVDEVFKKEKLSTIKTNILFDLTDILWCCGDFWTSLYKKILETHDIEYIDTKIDFSESCLKECFKFMKSNFVIWNKKESSEVQDK